MTRDATPIVPAEALIPYNFYDKLGVHFYVDVNVWISLSKLYRSFQAQSFSF
jgi:hypothetical protein